MLVPMFMFYHVIWLMRSVKLGSCAHFEYGNYLIYKAIFNHTRFILNSEYQAGLIWSTTSFFPPL